MSAPAGSGTRDQAGDRGAHPVGGALRTQEPRELFARHARKDGRTVAVLRGLDFGDRCVVEVEVFPRGAPGGGAVRPGPFSFADAEEATRFVTETVQALVYLGCDVHSQ